VRAATRGVHDALSQRSSGIIQELSERRSCGDEQAFDARGILAKRPDLQVEESVQCEHDYSKLEDDSSPRCAYSRRFSAWSPVDLGSETYGKLHWQKFIST